MLGCSTFRLLSQASARLVGTISLRWFLELAINFQAARRPLCITVQIVQRYVRHYICMRLSAFCKIKAGCSQCCRTCLVEKDARTILLGTLYIIVKRSDGINCHRLK